MRCRKARALLPLYVGRDLPSSLEKKLEGHLRRCLPCSAEKAAFEAALIKVRQEAAKEQELDWQSADWANLIDRIGEEKHPGKLLLSPHWRWALIYGLPFCILALAWVGIFGGRFLRFGKIPSPPLKEVARSHAIEYPAPFEEALPPTPTPEETLWASFPEQKKKLQSPRHPLIHPKSLPSISFLNKLAFR